MAVVATRELALPEGYDFAATVGALPISAHDPCFRIADGAFWWATRTPDGPATLSLRRRNKVLEATGFGPGAGWVVDQADSVAGLRDDLEGFAEVARHHTVVAELARRYRGHRLTALRRVFPRLIRTIFEQKVTGLEAHRSYTKTLRHFGEPAPGPLPTLLLPPDPAALAATPYWVFHPFGVEQRRTETLLRAAAAATQLEAAPDTATLSARLTAIPGIGPWTAAEITRVVFGDPDAVSVGDYHNPHMVAWALAGQVRAGAREAGPEGGISPADRRMLELLEPFRGHRGRVCVLLKLGGIQAPRFGPRYAPRTFAAY